MSLDDNSLSGGERGLVNPIVVVGITVLLVPHSGTNGGACPTGLGAEVVEGDLGRVVGAWPLWLSSARKGEADKRKVEVSAHQPGATVR